MTPDLLQRYPLLKKAMEEIKATAEFKSYAGQDYVTAFHTRICTIVDETIDRPAPQKEALMVAAVIGIGGSPFVFDELLNDRTRFAKDYSTDVQKVIDRVYQRPEYKNLAATLKLLVKETLKSVFNKNSLPTDMAQIATVVQIAADEDLIKSSTVIAGLGDHMRAMAAQQEKSFLPSLQAPRLETLFKTTKKQLIERTNTTSENNAATPQKHGRP